MNAVQAKLPDTEAVRAIAHNYARTLRGEIADAVPGAGQGIALIASEYDIRFSEGMQGARDLMVFLYRVAGVRACRVCGCTDDEACKGGCSWAGTDLCSRCIPQRRRKRGR